jgi:hypothetical protein
MNIDSNIWGLVVPVRVEALLISAVDAHRYNKFAPPYANFTFLPQKNLNKGPYLSQVALAAPFTGYRTMPEGVHLHWQLPHALRKGTVGDDGQVKMPAVPDRWLVTRLIVNRSTGEIQTPRSWVVESDYVHSAPTYSSTNIPVAPTRAAPQPYRYLGRVYDYADWQQNGNKGTYLAEPLTATGFGIPNFAACYQNCRNVFGIVDTELNTSFDAQALDLNYVVCGWYSSEADDPLHGQSINGRENAFGWLFDDLSGTLSPAYTLVQGIVQQVNWNPKLPGGYFPGDDPMGAFVAVGNTSAEALAALINWELRDQSLPNVERVLNALQLGVLPALAQPGGLALFEETLFNNEFAGQPGPSVWEIHAREGQQFVPVDETTVNKLAEINATDELRVANALKLGTLRQQIFADWQKFMLLLHAPPSEAGEPPDVNDVYAYVVQELGSLLELVQTSAGYDQRVMALSQEIWGRLPPEMELSSRPGERYSQPTDPVLLFSGEGVPPQPPDNANTATCVVTTLLMTAINFPASLVPGSVACSLNASVLPGFGDPAALPYPGIETAYRALLLVSKGMTPALAALLAANGGAGNPASIDPKATAAALNEAQADWLAATAPKNQIVFNGPTPQGNILYRTWTIPWYPIALSWRFDFYPLVEITHDPASTYPVDTIIKKLTYDPSDFDYVYPGGGSFSSTPQQYQGSVLLSAGAAIDLRNQIEQYLRYHDDDELVRILADMSNYPVLAQSLSGLRDTLNMLEPAMQLPIADPLATNSVYANFSNVQVHDAVGDQNQRTPQLNFMYNPLCAGKGVLRALTVTDSFGRSRAANVVNLIISETIPRQPATGDLLPELLLPPRLAQAAQLSFQFMSARDATQQMSALPGGQPVCGWVTPNHLDGSLMFYNSDGTTIGYLQPTADNGALYWLNAPGGPLFDEPIEIALAGANPVLRSFVMSTYGNGPLYVRELIRTFDRTRTWITPDSFQESSPTAVLVGTPMALVQATFSMKTAGLAEPDQSYEALVADMKKDNPLNRTVHGFPEIKFPVILGSQSELDDGLYGFFLATAGMPAGVYDFSVFYSDAAPADDPKISKPVPQTLTITSAATDPVRGALLIDPRCSVHAYSGVLPVNTINIPSSVYGAALALLRFTFLTSPVVWGGGPGTIMPIPGEGDGIWKWVIRNPADWVVTGITEPDSNATLQNAAGASEGWLQYNRNINP